jgi:anaerobic glycerol-3-phosphate dehydrogenase
VGEEIMTPEEFLNEQRLRLQHGCRHEAWVVTEIGTPPCTEKIQPVVCLANDDDGFYVQNFHSRAELEAFIAHLNKVADDAWGPK